METIAFGRTGFKVARLGLGCAPGAYLKTEQNALAQLVESLLDKGMNLLDTAASYPGSEQFIGERLSHRRKDYILVSKAGARVEGLGDNDWSAAQISASIDRSLQRTRADQIDVMLLHTCDLATLQKGEAVGALVKARDAGKIKFAGYSGDNDTAAYAATLPDIAVIETSINIADQINIEKVLPAARSANVGVIVKRPVANAAWKDIEQQQGIYKNYSRLYAERLAKMGLHPRDIGFTADEAAAWPEMAVRFALSIPGAHVLIAGTSNATNALANLANINKGPLPADAVAKIRDAFHAADPEGTWTGQT